MLMGAHVVGTVNVVSVLAMAPVIQQALDLSATEVGLLMTAYYSGQATWSLPAGAFVDRRRDCRRPTGGGSTESHALVKRISCTLLALGR